MKNPKKKIGIAIHGGASDILPGTLKYEKEIRQALHKALNEGYDVLASGGKALFAVENAIKILEDCSFFNAGKGAAFTEAGDNELHACLMCGRTTDSGAISAVKNIKNPISLAKLILDDSKNLFLCADGAMEFAREKNVEVMPDSYFFTQASFESWQEKKMRLSKSSGTVGAVALDKTGDLAAGTSTGGLQNASRQRISDSAIVGAGTYADNTSCAISCTGDGEYFIRTVFSHVISDLMIYKNLSLKDAIQVAFKEKMSKFDLDLGVIGIDKNGLIEMFFNSERMYRGWKTEGLDPVVQIFPGE